MKCINSFLAFDVYGSTSIDISFFEELTFLYGLNGSGKTTALRLIMALLTPSVKTLLEIPFSRMELNGQLRNGSDIKIECNKSDGKLNIRSSLTSEELTVSIPRMDIDEIEMYIERECRNHPGLNAINEISSPIFLGLDRRFITPGNKFQRPQFNSRQMALEFEREKMIAEHQNYDPGLAEVSSIIIDFVRGLKIRQQKADSSFRKQLLLDSFAYVEPLQEGFSFGPPDEEMFNVFREKRITILATLQKLDLASEEFEKTSELFFSKIEEIITSVKSASKKKKGSKPVAKGSEPVFDQKYLNALTAWMVNRHQVDRIERLFQLVTEYQHVQDDIFKPINEFNTLINRFFEQTGKRVEISGEGTIKIKIGEDSRSMQGLSSGERQILIMLAHLALNKRLRKDGIFIVDEPELSLHMAWQDMFVEAVQSANPRLQIILATHSPAIIAGKRNNCVPVRKAVN